MKVRNVLACAAAVLALAGCNKNKQESNAVANEKVTITQATPPPGGNWTDVVNATSAGFMMGNPNAKVKLIEIGALSCPHCAEFEKVGVPTLMDKYVKSGQVSWEFRNFLLHGPDISATLIARCNGAKSFFPLVKAFYTDQPIWMGKVIAVPEDKMTQIQAQPENQQFVTLATIAGLQDWAAARGIPQAKSNQCLSDPKKIDQLVELSSDVTNEFPDFTGTPSFAINGKLVPDTFTWEKLQPQLDAALK